MRSLCTLLLLSASAILLITAPRAAAQGANTAESQAYLIGVGDQLDISVLGHDELKQTVTVLPDGTFDYPIAGRVHAAGLTVNGVEKKLIAGLSSELNQPEVTVVAHDLAVPKVSVLGAVVKPGLYDLKPGWRLLEAIAASGGPAQDATLTKVTVVRNSGTQSIPVDFVALMQDNGNAQDLPLKQGDVILVEQLDPTTVEVQVLGSVEKPATYFVPQGGSTIVNLLAQAGGPSKDAALSQVQVMHAGHVQTVDLRDHMDALNDPVADQRLMPGDTLLVPANPNTISVLGEVHSPAIYPIPDGQTLTPSEALALAGGPVQDANTHGVSIVRRDASGNATVTHFDMSVTLSGKSKTPEPALQNGDIVYIPARGQNQVNPWSLASLIPFAHL